MGYYTTVTGEITITPPIPWAEFKDSPFFNDDPDGWPDKEVMLRVETEDVDTPEGVLIRRTAMWRLKVRPDKTVVKVKPQITWPED